MNNPTQTPSFLIGNDFISIIVNGTPFTIYAADARYVKVLEVIKERQWDKLEATINTAKTIALFTAGQVSVLDGIVSYAGNPVNNAVVGKILEFYKNGFPYEPLCRFLDKLMSNPSKWSTEQLYNYLERYKLPITDEGNFLGYKAVTSDFKDKYTKTIDNSVGANPKMPRNQCEENHTIGCASSFHLGNIDYVKSFGSGDDNVILVEVNPKDVVSCPIECEYQKLRVCEYKVISHVGKVGDMKPFESEYAGDNDDKENEDEFGPVNLDNETPVIVPAPKSTVSLISTATPIGANAAYAAHKAGKMLSHSNVSVLVAPKDNKPRLYFRNVGPGWKLVDNRVSAPVVSPIIDKSQSIKIGQNAAYMANRSGLIVRNSINGAVYPPKSGILPRSFFRASTGWELVD